MYRGVFIVGRSMLWHEFLACQVFRVVFMRARQETVDDDMSLMIEQGRDPILDMDPWRGRRGSRKFCEWSTARGVFRARGMHLHAARSCRYLLPVGWILEDVGGRDAHRPQQLC